MNETENNEEKEPKRSWIEAFLTGLGVPANWAKVLAGAIIGALAAAGLLSQNGCTASVDIYPTGEQHFEGTIAIGHPATVTPQK